MTYRKLLAFVVALLWSHSAAAREIVINAVGDIMLAGSAAPACKKLGYDYPFAATSAELKRGDVAVGNLEAPLANQGTEFTDKRFRFRGGPKIAAALGRAGISVVTLANNHIMDFGDTALAETLLNLDSSGILHAGAGEDLTAARKEAVIQVQGAKVAFLAYSLTLPVDFYAGVGRPGAAPGYPGYFKEDIARAKASADYVIVSFHWGSEGATSPNRYQVATAHAAINAGADVVLGHHPHVLQGIELYKQGVILYSLGNFSFGSYSRTASRSLIARIRLGNGVKKVELLPLNVDNREVRFQPRLLKGPGGKTAIEEMKRLCRDMGTILVSNGGRLVVTRANTAQSAVREERKRNAPIIRGN